MKNKDNIEDGLFIWCNNYINDYFKNYLNRDIKDFEKKYKQSTDLFYRRGMHDLEELKSEIKVRTLNVIFGKKLDVNNYRRALVYSIIKKKLIDYLKTYINFKKNKDEFRKEHSMLLKREKEKSQLVSCIDEDLLEFNEELDQIKFGKVMEMFKEHLSMSQSGIFTWIKQGYTDKQIAKKLKISEKTVRRAYNEAVEIIKSVLYEDYNSSREKEKSIKLRELKRYRKAGIC